MQAELLAALAALSWAVGSLFSAAASSRMGAFAFTRWRLFFALTLLWALALWTGQWRSLDGGSIALLALSGLIGIFIGDTALFACMNRLGPRRSGVLFATHALFSTLLAWLFLGETLWGWTLVGGSLLVSGVMVAKVQNPLTAKTLFNTWASAAVAMALGMTLILQALQTGQANLVAIFSSLTPILLLPLLWGVYRRRPAWGAWGGALLAVVGAALIFQT